MDGGVAFAEREGEASASRVALLGLVVNENVGKQKVGASRVTRTAGVPEC